MPRSRVLRVTGETIVPPRSRVFRVSGTGAVKTTPRSRVIRIGGAGAAAVIVIPPTSQTNLEPEVQVTLTAALLGGAVADSWTWRRVSGPNVLIDGVGASVTVTTPSVMPPNSGTVVIGVRATKDGVTSAEVTCTLTVLPQIRWTYSRTSSSWVGAKRRVRL